MMNQDYKVSLRTEDAIAALALQWRELAGINDQSQVDVVNFVERLCRTELPEKGRPKLSIFDGEVGQPRAYVTFRPTFINIERETWDFAKYRDPESNYILVHEVGHVIMHDHHAKAFAEGTIKYNMHGLEDWSAEWQANQFADHFLLPAHILSRHHSIEDVVVQCGVSRSFARRRWSKRLPINKFLTSYVGEACPECANFTLVRNGACLKCDICGAATGCN